MAIPGRTQSKKYRPSKRLETIALYKEIAQRTALPPETVRYIFETFTEVLTESLLSDTKVVVRHFGTFHSRMIAQGSAIRFKPALELKEKVQRAITPPTMEKLNVVLNNEAVLLAKVTGECPACKSKLETKDPPNCPNCGTAPFEEKKK